jgi:hypothetical protein
VGGWGACWGGGGLAGLCALSGPRVVLGPSFVVASGAATIDLHILASFVAFDLVYVSE